MSESVWTQPFLDSMRTVGDPLADDAVATLFQQGDTAAVNALMQTLVRNDGLPPAQLPPIILDYLQKTSALPLLEPAKVRRAQTLFGLFGPEILLVLGFYSLPAAYAARKGVQVLHRTGVLLRGPLRRVFETTQMVVDVMADGGLGPEGRGVRSAQKVRLMHAAVRHLITHEPRNPWSEELGVPVNQEDLAGTLMTFSFIVLDGLQRLGVILSAEDQDAWLQAWLAIGRIMGVREDLLPATVAEARTLTTLIHQRQIAPSPEGMALADSLLKGYQQLMPPGPLQGMPASLVHFFLDVDPFSGQDVAAMLGIPPADWTQSVIHVVNTVGAALGEFGLHDTLPGQVMAHVSRLTIEAMLLVERGGSRAPFSIPDKLLSQWKIAPRAISA
ncbi:oxygenase MpaB family protein [Corallococcus llansteffanensis]|uniref:DUF2236 domain-containing protein n=1 Tax=Corallococcus llansteffanensis TaxID=2316731 RepID=A0A3A8QPM9_9BACT|nr:oxygenase MpaB family protein [Corallococcus llansteffanensis]RKH65184.1 DUF2236 domain-containing protein [Corallococcus llansteffanensis]